MPVVGDTKIRFGRSYVYLNPPVSGGAANNEAGLGVWRLSIPDCFVPGGGSQPVSNVSGSGNVDASSLQILEGQLVYVTATGTIKPAIATSTATSKVVGMALDTKSAGEVLEYTRNFSTPIYSVANCVDNETNLSVNTWYYLSATNAGNWTKTPDTTTPGYVVIQCGLATEIGKMAVEIQNPTVI